MGGAVVSRLIVLGFGTLYPAYASYKAVKSANVRQYVRWMMYWIVFALFITVETFTDILLSWVPFYYEIKVGFIIWLLSPYTKGAAFLYRKFIHPYLSEKETEIDSFLSSAKEKSYATMVTYGSKGINVATSAVVTAAVKGQAAMSERLKSFSVNDLSRLSDDTPIHAMGPLPPYNPPVQREIHRGAATARQPMHIERQHSDGTEVDIDTFEVIDGDASSTSSGLVMHRVPSGDDVDGASYMGSQYKAYSMMNLSRPEETETVNMTHNMEFTSAPPEVSVDDSVIPDHAELFPRGDPAYSTLPRQRKSKKSKKKEESSAGTSLRRSKRRSKPQSYEESDEEQYHA